MQSSEFWLGALCSGWSVSVPPRWPSWHCVRQANYTLVAVWKRHWALMH